MGNLAQGVRGLRQAGLILLAATRLHADTPSWPLSLGSCAVLQAPPGEVRSLYWDLYQHTEVCVNLAPQSGPEGPSPLAFSFSFTHTGRERKASPAFVVLHVQLPPTYVVLSASLHIVLDQAERFDLTASQQLYRVTFPPGCTTEGGCGFTGLDALLSRDAFAHLVKARVISGEAFGIPFVLSPDAGQALSLFAERLGPLEGQE